MSIILFFAVLAVLILSHEFGHFIFAKKFGLWVEEFGFGLPPRLFGFKTVKSERTEKILEKESIEVELDTIKFGQDEIIKEIIKEEKKEKEYIVPFKKRIFYWIFQKNKKKDEEEKSKDSTIYSINLIPFGGFVKIFGEDGGEKENRRSFSAQKIWVRALIIFAGVLFNWILAWPFLTAVFFLGAPVSIDNYDISKGILIDKKIMIVQVQENTPAKEAGLKEGDFLLSLESLNKNKISNIPNTSDIKEIQDFILENAGEKIKINYLRGKKENSITVIPNKNPEIGKGNLGIAMDNIGILKLPFHSAVLEGLKSNFNLTADIVKNLFLFFKDIFSERKMTGQISGPVGIASLINNAAQLGLTFVLRLIALLSIYLAILNIFPFPALDGGHLLFLAIEAIKRKPISQKAVNIAHNIGFAILILLMLIVTYKDIFRLIK